MMPQCLANGCRNDSDKMDVTLHPFPPHPEAAQRWARLCGVSAQDVERGGWGRYRVCSLHFEDEAYERHPDSTAGGSRNEGRRLRQGAEPSLFLSGPPESEDGAREAQADGSSVTPGHSDGQIHSSAASCSSCTCTYPLPQTSRTVQTPDPQKSTKPGICGAEPATSASPCTPETTVLHPQRGASQIVLNFGGQNNGVTLGGVSPESVCQCPQGSGHQQRVVRQVVLLFLDPPPASAPRPSHDPPLLVNSRTQTEGPGSHDPSHHAPPLQTSVTLTQTLSDGNRGHVEDGEISGPPGPSSDTTPTDSLHRAPAAGTQTEADSPPHLPRRSCSSQTEPPPSGGVQQRSCTDPALTVDGWSQTPPDALPAPRPLGECGLTPPRGRPSCGTSCQTLPCINQCVGDLLAQHRVTPGDPPHHPRLPPSSRCPCIQSRVRQVVLNFLEEESKPGSQDVPDPQPASRPSPPGSPAHQHQGTQTGEDLLRQLLERPGRPRRLERPPQSRSCPPRLDGSSAPPLDQQEETHSPLSPLTDQPMPQCQPTQEDMVLFDDIVVYFSKEEWDMLGSDARGLYREVMSENYHSLVSLGFLVEKPDLVCRIEREEEDLWEDRASARRLARRAEDNLRFLDLGTGGVRFLKNMEARANPDRESAESSSHLGALMRLVNEIPGFLFGGSGTDGSASPIGSLEDHETASRPRSQVKTEEGSLKSPAAPLCSPPLTDALEMADGPGEPRNAEPCPSKVTVKVEEQVTVNHSSRHSAPSCHPGISPLSIKSDPGSCYEGVQIKQEVPASASPARAPPVKTTPPDAGRRPCSRGGTSPWASVSVNRSLGTSPRHPSVSPAVSDGASSAGLADLKIKVKQEDSGSERDSVESPICDRKVYNSPMLSPSSVRQLEREHWRLGASSTVSLAENVLPGSSPLHKLVNCLKEITAGRPRAHSNVFSPARWGPDVSRQYADLRATGSLGSRGPEVPAAKPNPFTAAAMNGTPRLKNRETRTPESRGTAPSRPGERQSVGETQPSGAALSALGRTLTRVSGGQHLGRSEEPRRPEMGVKRTHSDDLTRMPGASRAKKPALEASRRHDLWRPPEDPQTTPGDDQPIGRSHLMSVMECVRRIPSSRPRPAVRGAEPDLSRPWKQSASAEDKPIVVKVEEGPSPPRPPSSQWLQPPPHPDGTERTGSSATNVHLNGLRRLMEEIPCVESSNSSRAMFTIAVGHSVTRRLDGANYLSCCNDDGGFQADLNDCTVASVDSVFSDDTSWSSENVDPSYSALGGLQKVVSEFADLGSVSPLVAVSAPPLSAPEGSGLKKPREGVTAAASQEGVRRSAGGASGGGASACSAENGAAAFAALCGLQKVVRGFVDQECVSPMSAVRSNAPGPRDPAPRRPALHEEEGQSPRHPGFSPAPSSRFLCEGGPWVPAPDSSYSALVGLQKVVSGFSEMSCVSPFSAVSTAASEPPTQDPLCPTPGGMKAAINGCDPGGESPLTVTSYPSSEGEPDPGVRRKCDRAPEDPGHAPDSSSNPRNTPGTSSHCIDLTQEEEPGPGQLTASTQGNLKKMREGVRATGPFSRGQLIDLTEEEETPNKPKGSGSGANRKYPHSGSPKTRPFPDQSRRPHIDPSRAQRVTGDRPLDPRPSGPSRGGVPVVNEHLSGLEKLLKGVPSFTPTSSPRTQNWSGSWWFKSTSPHET